MVFRRRLRFGKRRFRSRFRRAKSLLRRRRSYGRRYKRAKSTLRRAKLRRFRGAHGRARAESTNRRRVRFGSKSRQTEEAWFVPYYVGSTVGTTNWYPLFGPGVLKPGSGTLTATRDAPNTIQTVAMDTDCSAYDMVGIPYFAFDATLLYKLFTRMSTLLFNNLVHQIRFRGIKFTINFPDISAITAYHEFDSRTAITSDAVNRYNGPGSRIGRNSDWSVYYVKDPWMLTPPNFNGSYNQSGTSLYNPNDPEVTNAPYTLDWLRKYGVKIPFRRRLSFWMEPVRVGMNFYSRIPGASEFPPNYKLTLDPASRPIFTGSSADPQLQMTGRPSLATGSLVWYPFPAGSSKNKWYDVRSLVDDATGTAIAPVFTPFTLVVVNDFSGELFDPGLGDQPNNFPYSCRARLYYQTRGQDEKVIPYRQVRDVTGLNWRNPYRPTIGAIGPGTP